MATTSTPEPRPSRTGARTIRRRIGAIALALAGAAALAWSFGHALTPVPDPVHRGKPLSQWLAEHGQIDWRGDLDTLTPEAREAVRAFGPAALPLLHDWLGRSDPILTRGLMSLGWNRPLPSGLADAQIKRCRAVSGFYALDRSVHPDWPAVVAILLHADDEHQAAVIGCVLSRGDAEPWRLLAEATDDPNPRIRARAARALWGYPDHCKGFVGPVLRRLAADPDPAVRGAADAAPR